MREDRLIAKIKAKAGRIRSSQHAASRSRDAMLSIGDDAARWIPKKGYEALLTCDWFLENTHFLRAKHSPDSVGWKCLARAVSDIAAMGGEPVGFLMSLALPESLTGRWLDQFLGGLGHATSRLACPLVGGDTTRREEVLINITVVGQIPAGRAVLRSGARVGDVLFVSGTLGEAELGLSLIRHGQKSAPANGSLLRKHLYPEPRLALGRWLAEKGLASAMMDLSDGLSTDLPRLCAASSVGALIDASKVPAVRVPRLRYGGRNLDPLELALHGGDDYELLFAVPRAKADHVPGSFRGLRIMAIGEVRKDRTLILRRSNGRETALTNRGWDPFRKKR